MKIKHGLVISFLGLCAVNSFATSTTNSPSKFNAPTRTTQLFVNKDSMHKKEITLKGSNPNSTIEFTVRKDEIVRSAVLNLDFTPSPALIPLESQLKIYLNDELMRVIPFAADQLGKSNHIQIPLDIRFIKDYNQVVFKFISHYKAICEDPVNSTLWLDISSLSNLSLDFQTLEIKNDLSIFPQPFFDELDANTVVVPIVFPGQPNLEQERAAAILASWFGAKAEWRGQSFPVYFNQLPDTNAVVFATNNQRPDFLKNYPKAENATIAVMDHPTNPYRKLLVISGRDEKDLVKAVTGIGQGSVLFRGSKVTVEKVKTIAKRKPYDAPNWLRTDEPTRFSHMQKYKSQLQTEGFVPPDIKLSFVIPPDLFLAHKKGIMIKLKYRYSTPTNLGNSKLNVRLNSSFVRSFSLLQDKSSQLLSNLSSKNVTTNDQTFYIPSSEVSPNNLLEFGFEYANAIGGGSADGRCETYTLVDNYGAIDNRSSIDLSNYRHFIAMPNLSVFTNAGFPFSRLADLSQTTIVMNNAKEAIALTTLFNTVGAIGAHTGFPALKMTLVDNWAAIKNHDDDILLIGSLPPELHQDKKINMFIKGASSWINEPFRHDKMLETKPDPKDMVVNTKTDVNSPTTIAAMVGLQSPFSRNHSVVALMADTTHGFELLNDAITNKAKQGSIYGSIAVIRDSGISSMQVGDVYYVGHLPWWERIWYALQKHPINLALSTVIAAMIVTYVTWRGMKIISRRRLRIHDED